MERSRIDEKLAMAKQPYRYPFPPFPVGWFAVAYSDELSLGGVKPIDAFGQQLVLFRGEDGVARVFDALCPHLGAHLGHSGAISGNGIVCPFHHWAFDGAGRCVDIPYSTRPIPRQARVRSWPVREVNQAIFVWYDPQQRPPFWELPVVPQAGAADWTRPHSIDRVARFHCQEIRENGVDPAHFGTVHGFPVQAFEVEARGHVLRQTSRLTAQLGPEASDVARLTVDYHGLGYAVAHQIIGEMEFLVLSHVTPIDQDTTFLRFSVSLRRIPSMRSLGALFSHLREAGGKQGLWGMARRFTEGARAQEIPGYLARAAAGTSRGIAATRGRSLLGEIMTQLIAIPTTVDFGRQLDQDIYITENKAYLEQPLYRDGEHTIHAMRQWARQFYADAEPARPPAQAS